MCSVCDIEKFNDPARPMVYVIASVERLRSGAFWWRPDRRGYTHLIVNAGLFSHAEAADIVANSRGGDVSIPLNLAVAIAANGAASLEGVRTHG